ncbi:MAG: NAD(+) diphosphatase [Opitutaceae bacterium]|nr:NAD(+) diphosphatase [Opitutaceae bacterium]MBL4721517.1 NAD(+) diphosphatase [Alphaproteobacteria bacterium]
MNRVNFYAGADIDRIGDKRRDPDWLQGRISANVARVLPVWRGKSLFAREPDADGVYQIAWLSPEQVEPLIAESSTGAPGTVADALHLLGEREDGVYFTIDLSHHDDPLSAVPGLDAAFTGLRDLGAAVDHTDGAMLSYAKGMAHWHKRHPFCSDCGAPTEVRSSGHTRVCTNADCGVTHFPRTDSAVIMLVHQGDRCILAHNKRNPKPSYSTLAGFVEPGESLEEAVAREVLEEVGVRVGRVAYHSSQPWPFPGNLMLGFHAEALSEEITVDETELVEARWFSRDDVRDAEKLGLQLSRPISISRRLIEDWVNGVV